MAAQKSERTKILSRRQKRTKIQIFMKKILTLSAAFLCEYVCYHHRQYLCGAVAQTEILDCGKSV